MQSLDCPRGGSDDKRLRDFDIKTGKELWTFKLPASLYGTSMNHRGKDGKQYVAAVTTGGFEPKWQLPTVSQHLLNPEWKKTDDPD